MAKHSKEEAMWSSLLPLVSEFVPLRSQGDPLWEFFVRVGRRWRRFRVTQYEGTFHFFGCDFGPILVDPKKLSSAPIDEETRQTLTALAIELERVRRRVAEDPMEYHRWLTRALSPSLRYGVIARPFTREFLPDFLRYDRELKRAEKTRMVQLLARWPRENAGPMTANRYFEYCALAYRANPVTFGEAFDVTMPGRALYQRFADGRDGGLLALPGDSESAFRKWFEGREWAGAHPFEIYRGGNSTHIDLHVTRDPSGSSWTVLLDAFSSTRLSECCRIALALEMANLPFEMAHRESYLRRLLEEDWVGVVPEGHSLSYGWQDIPSELGVADCVYFSWLAEGARSIEWSKARVATLVSWLPIQPLFLQKPEQGVESRAGSL